MSESDATLLVRFDAGRLKHGRKTAAMACPPAHIRREGLSRTTPKNQTARRIEVSTLNQHRVHLCKLLAHLAPRRRRMRLSSLRRMTRSPGCFRNAGLRRGRWGEPGGGVVGGVSGLICTVVA